MFIWEKATLTRKYQNIDNSIAQDIPQIFRKFSQNKYLLVLLLLLLILSIKNKNNTWSCYHILVEHSMP